MKKLAFYLICLSIMLVFSGALLKLEFGHTSSLSNGLFYAGIISSVITILILVYEFLWKANSKPNRVG